MQNITAICGILRRRVLDCDIMDNMMTNETRQQAIKAIVAHDPGAYAIVGHDGKNFSARVGYCIAYYVIIDGQIVGDVWYE